MEPFPTQVDLAANPDAQGQGHLWILEAVEGVPLRFALRDDGRLIFGNSTGRLDSDSIPSAIRPAVAAVRSSFRRDAFREALEDVEGVTFYGVATCQHRLAYDWDRLPAFLGYDVRSPARGGLLDPAGAHASFERLGLDPSRALEREVRADAVDPGRYEFPPSEWADGPVAGVILADKHGWRGRLDNPERPGQFTADIDSPAEAAAELVTSSSTGAVEEIRNHVARAHRAELSAAGIDPDGSAFRSAVAEVVQRSRS